MYIRLNLHWAAFVYHHFMLLKALPVGMISPWSARITFWGSPWLYCRSIIVFLICMLPHDEILCSHYINFNSHVHKPSVSPAICPQVCFIRLYGDLCSIEKIWWIGFRQILIERNIFFYIFSSMSLCPAFRNFNCRVAIFVIWWSWLMLKGKKVTRWYYRHFSFFFVFFVPASYIPFQPFTCAVFSSTNSSEKLLSVTCILVVSDVIWEKKDWKFGLKSSLTEGSAAAFWVAGWLWSRIDWLFWPNTIWQNRYPLI